MLEGLADFPGPAEFLHVALQVTPRHVEADGVAEDVAERVLRFDVDAARFQRHHQLDLEMQVAGLGRIGEAAGGQDVAGVFLEEERRLLVGVMPHFARVLGIVAPDAVDAMDRKQRGGAGNGHGWLLLRIENIVGHDRPRRSALPSHFPARRSKGPARAPVAGGRRPAWFERVDAVRLS